MDALHSTFWMLRFKPPGVLTARSLSQRFAEQINVMDYQAKGDGVTDDTLALRDAINAANGRVVFFPKGRYRVTSSLLLDAPTKCRISGIGHESVIVSEVNGPAMRVGAGLGQNFQARGLIENIAFEAAGVAITSPTACGLHIANLYGMRVAGVKASGFGDTGLLVDPLQVTDEVGIVHLEGCYCLGNGYGIRIGHTSNGIHDVHVWRSWSEGNKVNNLRCHAVSGNFSFIGNDFYLGAGSLLENVRLDNLDAFEFVGNYIEGGDQLLKLNCSSAAAGGFMSAGSIRCNRFQNVNPGAVAIRIGDGLVEEFHAMAITENHFLSGAIGVNFLGPVKRMRLGPNYFSGGIITPYSTFAAGSDGTVQDGDYFLAKRLIAGHAKSMQLYNNGADNVIQVDGQKVRFFDAAISHIMADCDSAKVVNATSLSIYDHNSGGLQRILVGANGTGPGGIGRALYFANSV